MQSIEEIPRSHVTVLNLSRMNLSDLRGLIKYLPDIVVLSLRDNLIEDIAPLFEQLSNLSLRHLDLSDNLISNLSALTKHLPKSKLEALDLSINSIRNIQPLRKALQGSALKNLNLSRNMITSVYALQGNALKKSNLRVLNISHNEIRNLKPLAQGLIDSKVDTLQIQHSLYDESFPLFPLIEVIPKTRLTAVYVISSVVAFNTTIEYQQMVEAITENYIRMKSSFLLHFIACARSNVFRRWKKIPSELWRELSKFIFKL